MLRPQFNLLRAVVSFLLLIALTVAAALVAMSISRGSSLYYSAAFSPDRASSQWVAEHQALLPRNAALTRALDGARFGASGERSDVCIGVTLFLREEPYVLGAITSLLLRALDETGRVGSAHVPHSLVIYWQPTPAVAAGNTSAHWVTRELSARGIQVVRVDEGVALERRAQTRACMHDAVPVLPIEADEGDLHNGISENIVSPPHMFGFALRDMARRARSTGCRHALMIEDDVFAAVNWESQLRTHIAAVIALDPAWRMVKLFVPSFFNSWYLGDFLFWSLALFVLFYLFLIIFYATARRVLHFCNSGSGGVLSRRRLEMRDPPFLGTRTNVVSAAFVTTSVVIFYFLAGRSSAPCIANADACAGIAPIDSIEGVVFSQAQVFNVATIESFADCLEFTPRVSPLASIALPKARHDMCWQIDLAMAHCFASTSSTVATTDVIDRESCAALPRVPSLTDCLPSVAKISSGVFRARPSTFQHVGILDAGGGLKGLRISEEWQARSETLASLQRLVGRGTYNSLDATK